MPMIWNETAFAKLCSAILATTDVKLDYKKLAEFMGPEATHRGVEYQIQKLKKNLKSSGLSSTHTPPKVPLTAKSTGKRKAAKDADADDSAGAEDTPSKPAKTKLAKIVVYDDSGEDTKDDAI